jgi:hypothetical protein
VRAWPTQGRPLTQPLSLDRRLLDPEFGATDTQRRYFEAVELHGGASAASRVLGVSKGTIARSMAALQAKAASKGYAPQHDMTHTVPDGYRVKGVSGYYGSDGQLRGQWVKTEINRDRTEALIRQFVEDLVADARGLCPPTPSPDYQLEDLLAVYAIGDPHFGMYAWAEETGDDFDLDKAERLTRGAIDRLVTSAPAAKRALLLQAGDMFHADNSSNQTPASGHALDVDTRYAKVMQVGLRAMVYAIRRLLEKHEEVEAWMLPGNHDPHSSFALALCLQAFFENEPRVKIDLGPGLYKFLRFGKVLIGGHHGHGAKVADLPLLMAVDRAQDWGETDHRYVYIGHIHHDTVKEIMGVRVESLRTLATKDAWHAGKGYRAGRDMRLIVHHRDHGEVERHTCGASMLAA